MTKRAVLVLVLVAGVMGALLSTASASRVLRSRRFQQIGSVSASHGASPISSIPAGSASHAASGSPPPEAGPPSASSSSTSMNSLATVLTTASAGSLSAGSPSQASLASVSSSSAALPAGPSAPTGSSSISSSVLPGSTSISASTSTSTTSVASTSGSASTAASAASSSSSAEACAKDPKKCAYGVTEIERLDPEIRALLPGGAPAKELARQKAAVDAAFAADAAAAAAAAAHHSSSGSEAAAVPASGSALPSSSLSSPSTSASTPGSSSAAASVSAPTLSAPSTPTSHSEHHSGHHSHHSHHDSSLSAMRFAKVLPQDLQVSALKDETWGFSDPVSRAARNEAERAENAKAVERLNLNTHFQLKSEKGADTKYDIEFDRQHGLSPTMSVSTIGIKKAEKLLEVADKRHDEFETRHAMDCEGSICPKAVPGVV